MRKKANKTAEINKLLTIGLLVGGGFVLYKIYKTANQVELAAAKLNQGGLKTLL